MRADKIFLAHFVSRKSIKSFKSYVRKTCPLINNFIMNQTLKKKILYYIADHSRSVNHNILFSGYQAIICKSLVCFG